MPASLTPLMSALPTGAVIQTLNRYRRKRMWTMRLWRHLWRTMRTKMSPLRGERRRSSSSCYTSLTPTPILPMRPVSHPNRRGLQPTGGRSTLRERQKVKILPDKKLLEFILDRLQKKDTMEFSLRGDYHGIIEHPMDFGTVRMRLSSGAYRNLEHFEKDVFLISLNAMRYNASDTIYFRQARSVHELAKKSFENLRQESDDNNDPEPKIVRRGRPPGSGKNNIIRPVDRPPAGRVGSEFSSEASLANASNGNLSSSPVTDVLRRGSELHKQYQLSSTPELPALTAPAVDRKILVPVSGLFSTSSFTP